MSVQSLPRANRRSRLLKAVAATILSLAAILAAAITLSWAQAGGGREWPPAQVSDEANLEKQAREIAELLRAPCCPHLNAAQHHSPETLAMRREIREMLEAGEGRRAIIKALKAKYGDQIAPGLIPELWKPWVYWGGPVVGLLLLVLLGRWMGSRQKSLSVLHVEEGGDKDRSGKEAA